MPYIYWDIETTGLDPKKSKLKCAVFQRDDTVTVTLSVEETVAHILASDKADTFVSFNGGSFDFFFLAEQIEDAVARGRLAHIALRRHVDIMLDFLADHGYRSSMASFAAMIDGVGKTWTGKEAAEAGDEDIEKVVEYCKNDVVVLATIHHTAIEQRFLRRQTSTGRTHLWVLLRPNCFRPVHQCLTMAANMKADQGWMTDPSKVSVHASMAWCEECLTRALE